jgi:hypothetical protein
MAIFEDHIITNSKNIPKPLYFRKRLEHIPKLTHIKAIVRETKSNIEEMLE